MGEAREEMIERESIEITCDFSLSQHSQQHTYVNEVDAARDPKLTILEGRSCLVLDPRKLLQAPRPDHTIPLIWFASG